MIHVYLDASALVKRYRQETGSDVVNDTVNRVASSHPRYVIVSSLGISETLSILNRRRNEASIPLEAFNRSLRGILEDIRRFSHALVIDDQLILASTQYTLKHNINSADAIHLAVLLSLRSALDASRDELLCLAADRRLVRGRTLDGQSRRDIIANPLTERIMKFGPSAFVP